MKGKMAIAQSKIRFEEVFDPFPSEDDVMDDSCLGPKYKELAKDLFGETEERMIVLIKEFKEATKKDGINIPGCMLYHELHQPLTETNQLLLYLQTLTFFVEGFFVLVDVTLMKHSRFSIAISQYTSCVHIIMRICFQWAKMTRHTRLK